LSICIFVFDIQIINSGYNGGERDKKTEWQQLEDYKDVVLFGKTHHDFFKDSLSLSNSIPSHDRASGKMD